MNASTITKIGVLGGGQLGRMLALEARRMGFRVIKWTGGEVSGAAELADHIITDEFDSETALDEFIESSDVVTIEFENIPTSLLETLQSKLPLNPSPRALNVTQNRDLEKNFLRDHGIPTTPFQIIESAESLATALQKMSTDSILKTISGGYDGKGQIAINLGTAASQAESIWQDIGQQRSILEEKVQLAGEFSVIVIRDKCGQIVTYQAIENIHQNHVLHLSISPARIADKALNDAQVIAEKVATSLDYVGVLTIEFFISETGEILVNELAPRPHNSGHLTIEAHHTSQFEQQVRVSAELPLGCTEQIQPAVMLNLLGDLWPASDRAPDWTEVLKTSGANLHLYGKKVAKPGRKMGHITFLASSAEIALENARNVYDSLSRQTQ